jgi:hypothetical protein
MSCRLAVARSLSASSRSAAARVPFLGGLRRRRFGLFGGLPEVVLPPDGRLAGAALCGGAIGRRALEPRRFLYGAATLARYGRRRLGGTRRFQGRREPGELVRARAQGTHGLFLPLGLFNVDQGRQRFCGTRPAFASRRGAEFGFEAGYEGVALLANGSVTRAYPAAIDDFVLLDYLDKLFEVGSFDAHKGNYTLEKWLVKF